MSAKAGWVKATYGVKDFYSREFSNRVWGKIEQVGTVYSCETFNCFIGYCPTVKKSKAKVMGVIRRELAEAQKTLEEMKK